MCAAVADRTANEIAFDIRSTRHSTALSSSTARAHSIRADRVVLMIDYWYLTV